MADAFIQDLLAQLQENPGDWALRSRICDAMLLEGRTGEAAGLIEAAPEPPQAEPDVLKAAEVYALVHPEKAVPLLYAFLQANPSSATAHLAMAETALKLHQTPTAQSYYARAVELNPGYRDPDFERQHGLQSPAPRGSPASAARPEVADLPTADAPATGSAARKLAPVHPRKPAGAAVPGWVLTGIVALATFLLCWMLVALGLRALLLNALSVP